MRPVPYGAGQAKRTMRAHVRLRRFLVACIFAALILAASVLERGVSAASPAVGGASPARASQAKGTGSAKNSAQATNKSQVKKPRGRRKSSRRKRRQGQMRPTAERIREIQAALIERGYLKGEPTGVWNAESANAMERFQQANGLEPTGRFEARSLIKLGLGPETAGVGAPRPPAPPAAGPAAQPPASPGRGPRNPSGPPG